MFRTVSDVTRLLDAMQRGQPQAAEALLPLVYEELRRIAAYKIAQESDGHTLQPTALVHGAWLRVIGDGDEQFAGRAHFFAVAAEAMRRIPLRMEEAAAASGVPLRTAERLWTYARAWLRREVSSSRAVTSNPSPSSRRMASHPTRRPLLRPG